MAAYLVVDVDDLLLRFRSRGIVVDLQELAVGLRGGAALAAGLVSADKLKAIAVADWQKHRDQGSIDSQYVFKTAGYDVFDIPRRESLTDALIIHYFSYDPEPVSELILATTSPDLIPLVRRVKMTRNARIRMWGSEDVLKGTEFADEVIFQPLESLLGIQSKNVAIYIDFENISISLNEQGFVVNLDMLVSAFVTQAKAHGHVVKMAAYAPWGQRGTLPPLVDTSGREIADEAPSRLALANIDPVFNLPGKNSADVRIARDVITDASHSDSADVYILASGDRDFNDVLNTLVKRNKTVIVWGVRGSTSRQLEKNPGITIEYIDEFTRLQTHQSLSKSAVIEDSSESFTPSQWSSVVIQYDRLAYELESEQISIRRLVDQMVTVAAVISHQRGEDLISQAISLGVLRMVANGYVMVNAAHPIVEKTRLIRDRIAVRVANTLQVRGWEYVNYGFLLKGLAMDRDLERPGLNVDDQWRSHWIDALVREQVLERELIPHRHNPDDLVPVIKLSSNQLDLRATSEIPSLTYLSNQQEQMIDNLWLESTLDELEHVEAQTVDMVRRIVVSVEQFTSFRGFAWCPLGSLHRRLNTFDNGIAFQRAVEYLVENDAAVIEEYANPQSNYTTKGISLTMENELVREILSERDTFIRILLTLYNRDVLISRQSVQLEIPDQNWNLELWFSIMETENVLNALPGRQGQFSLFRMHHTVNQVAGTQEKEGEGEPDDATT
ncbi:MAG TPA: NYN domain-containing protein [Phototrophicaceae bacterium]|nr:NYN domain-containing protein [Phototrophicaceae bacterium]